MSWVSIRQVVRPFHVKSSCPSSSTFIKPTTTTFITFTSRRSSSSSSNVGFLKHNNMVAVCKASSSSSQGQGGGVSLGTMKLPSNIDIPRFETLLFQLMIRNLQCSFQWGNSLSQGANVPLPAPLKVDKIPGGARLGFIDIGDGPTEVFVYIDCLVTPATDGSSPMFRAIRNGPSKDQPPPGEPRIMRSLLEALNKCVQIARI
ncbi:hypothetical protein ACS0TY_016069 [Phlomoides rotata]